MRVFTFPALLAAVFAMACSRNVQPTTQGASAGGESPDDTGEGGGSSAADIRARPRLPCKDDSITSRDYEPFRCQLPSPCPAVVIVHKGFWVTPESEEVTIKNPGAAECVLTQLRDRTLSQLEIKLDPGRMMNRKITIFVLDAEHGAENREDHMDLFFQRSSRYHDLLKPRAYFDACIRERDAARIRQCLMEWSAGCADTEGAACPQ